MHAKQLSKKRLPDYPREALEKGIQRSVRLNIQIGEDGKVRDVKVLTGDPILATPVADEVKEWKFQPTLLNGQPFGVLTELDLEFSYRKDKGEVKATNARPQRLSH